MGSTNKTAHYELPQFVANDKPSWLGDVNEAMEAIDTGIYGAKSSADGAQQTANNAVAGVQSAGTRMDGIQTQLDTVATQANQTATTVAGHTSSIATNSANINTLNSRMGSTDISGIGDGTVTGAISAISGGGGGQELLNTVTSDGVKTIQQLLNELLGGADTTKITVNSYIEWTAGAEAEVFRISDLKSGQYVYGCVRIGTGATILDALKLDATTSSRVASTMTSTVATNDSSASVIASGNTFKLYA